MIDSSSIAVVVQAYRPERDALLELLEELAPQDWSRPTECPAYPVKGVATHVLGDDLSRAHTAERIRQLTSGPAEVIEVFAAAAGRP